MTVEDVTEFATAFAVGFIYPITILYCMQKGMYALGLLLYSLIPLSAVWHNYTFKKKQNLLGSEEK